MPSHISHLVQVEVGGVQSYIFDGSRLRGWRGASALLDRAERVSLPDTLEPYGEAVTTLRRGGGVVLLGVRAGELGENETPARVARRVKRTYQNEAPGAQVYGGCVPFDGSDVSASLAALTFEVTNERNRSPAPDPDVSLQGPMARPCGSCGARPAETDSEIHDDGTLLCSICAAKATHGGEVRWEPPEGSVLDRFATFLRRKPEASLSPETLRESVPEDLSAIAEVGAGSIALIQSDGNSLGKTIQQVQTRDEYRTLSEGLAEAVETAVFETLAEYEPRSHSTAGPTLPWEIMFLGGDDVLLAVSDEIALSVVRTLTERIEARTQKLFGRAPLDELGRSRLTMGTGLVVADPHVPMAVLRRLAHSLERSAKDRTYGLLEEEGREVSTVDFHRITGSGSASLSHIRDHVLRPRRTTDKYSVRLTERPYTVDELGEVEEVAHTWQGLPNTKLQALRESLFESPARAMKQWTHVVARAPERRRRAWQVLSRVVEDGADGTGMPFEFRDARSGASDDEQLVTPLLDVLDIHALLPNGRL